MNPRVKRVLALDGGGMRGYMQLIFLSLIQQNFGLTDPLYTYFDVICGTSVGSINGAGLALGKTIPELIPFYTNEGGWIFTIRNLDDELSGSINASTPGNRPNSAQKLEMLANGDPFYSSYDANSNYGSVRLYNVIDSVFGSATLSDLNTNVLFTGVDTTTSQPMLFSNYDSIGYHGANELVSTVTKYSSAAPIYLPSFNNYVDGGLACNNPSQLGLTLANRLYPNNEQVCVLNLSTGILPPADWSTDFYNIPFTGTAATLSDLIKVTLSAPNILTAQNLYQRDAYTLEDLVYYQFAPILDPVNQDVGLDNSDPAFLNYMYNLALDWYNSDTININKFMSKFLA